MAFPGLCSVALFLVLLLALISSHVVRAGQDPLGEKECWKCPVDGSTRACDAALNDDVPLTDAEKCTLEEGHKCFIHVNMEAVQRGCTTDTASGGIPEPQGSQMECDKMGTDDENKNNIEYCTCTRDVRDCNKWGHVKYRSADGMNDGDLAQQATDDNTTGAPNGAFRFTPSIIHLLLPALAALTAYRAFQLTP